MAYIGKIPAAAALTSSDIADSIITEAKMADDAISLTELKAGTDGEIISWDASGNPVAIGAGSSGEFLKSQGAGSQPVFAAAAGGGLVHLLTTNITSGTASVEFKHGTSSLVFDGTYNAYLFIISDAHPATDAQPLEMTVSTDTGSSYISTNYTFAHQGRADGTSELSHCSTSDSVFDISSQNVGNAADETISARIYLHKPAGTNSHKLINVTSTVIANDNAVSVSIMGGANHSTTSAIDAVKFKFGSGNIDRGNFSMFGVANS